MAGAQQGVAQPSRLFSVVGLVALRQAAPRSAAQRTQTTSVPPAGRGRVRRSATNATTLNTHLRGEGLRERGPLVSGFIGIFMSLPLRSLLLPFTVSRV